MQVEAVQTLHPLPGAQTYLEVAVDGQNKVFLAREERNLLCLQTVAGANTTLASVPYEPQQHRWWRLREQRGTLYWEVSAEGTQWTSLFSTPTPLDLGAVNISLGAGTYLTAPVPPGLAVFDSFNVPATRLARRVEERRLGALGVRERAAELAASRPHAEHFNNNDEVNYPQQAFIGNYSKSLRHDALGDPDPHSYGTLLRALESRDPGDFEEVLLASDAKKLTLLR